MEEKELELFKCQCRDCPIKEVCYLLAGQYCSYYNCIAQLPS